jgi:hypothetical protein
VAPASGHDASIRADATKRLGEIADQSGVSLATLYRRQKVGRIDDVTVNPEAVRKKCPHKSHRDVMAELHAGAEAAQTEWLDTLPLWSMT